MIIKEINGCFYHRDGLRIHSTSWQEAYFMVEEDFIKKCRLRATTSPVVQVLHDPDGCMSGAIANTNNEVGLEAAVAVLKENNFTETT